MWNPDLTSILLDASTAYTLLVVRLDVELFITKWATFRIELSFISSYSVFVIYADPKCGLVALIM